MFVDKPIRRIKELNLTVTEVRNQMYGYWKHYNDAYKDMCNSKLEKYLSTLPKHALTTIYNRCRAYKINSVFNEQ